MQTRLDSAAATVAWRQNSAAWTPGRGFSVECPVREDERQYEFMYMEQQGKVFPTMKEARKAVRAAYAGYMTPEKK